MSDSRIYTSMINFLRDKPRKILALALTCSVVFTTTAPLSKDANALTLWVTGVGSKVPPNGFSKMIVDHGLDSWRTNPSFMLMDFNPHYGFPFQYSPQFPYLSFPIGRKTWCLPQYKVWGVCLPPTLGLGKGWCNNPQGCAATNIFNVISTMEIRFSDDVIGRGGRMNEHPVPANVGIKPDYTARDACIRGAKIPHEEFDRKTAKINRDIPADKKYQQYDESVTGNVLGAKPDFSTCMSTINTPKVDITTTGNAAFVYYQNLGNWSFSPKSPDNRASMQSKEGTLKPATDAYGNDNRYLTSAFFIGGVAGCPDSLFEGTSLESPSNADQWRMKAEKCYDYYILQRATRPEWVLERPGIATDDPLTQDYPQGNPRQAIYNSCQMLMNGNDAERALLPGADFSELGFAPVLQYPNRPDLDEAEYLPGNILRRDFELAFPGKPVPEFKNELPCLITKYNAGPIRTTDWEHFNSLLVVNYAASYLVEAAFLGKAWEGPVLFRSIPEDITYNSPGVGKSGYCPNVERINSPSSPFSPRNYIAQKPEALDLILAPYKYNFLFRDSATKVFRTDRDYSYMTNWYGPLDRAFRGPYRFGYSGWIDVNRIGEPAYLAYLALYVVNGGMPDFNQLGRSAKFPEVQCAIVPVDILDSRREAFDRCIMQRINYNFATYRRYNFLRFYYKYTMQGGWQKPCVTRFWENDDYSKCPVSMSIKQCCRIIVKDVVPMNHVKIRTCEGLRQNRKLIFGYSHIYDATAKKYVPDEEAIARAQAIVDEKEAAFKARNVEYATAGLGVFFCVAGIAAGAQLSDMADPACAGAIAPFCSDQPSCHAACHVVPLINGGTNNDCSDILNGLGTHPLRDTWRQVVDARANLELARTLVVAVDDAAPTPEGGRYRATPTNEAEYNEILKENRKLTLIGCDNNEPDQYRFSNYVKLTGWSSVAANIELDIISEVMGSIQGMSNELLSKARDATVTGFMITMVDHVWKLFDTGKNVADNLIDDMESFAEILLVAKKNLYSNIYDAESAYHAFMASDDGAFLTMPRLLRLLNDPSGTQSLEIARVWVTSKLQLAVIEPITAGVYSSIHLIREQKEKAFWQVENVLKNAIQQIMEKREDIFNIAKTEGDRMILEGIELIQTEVNVSMNSLFNSLMALFDTNDKAALLLAGMGEGGANMPYMRWWDTGTSAGNPLHGGSFINTLGSFDTLIGVGREERDYFDATAEREVCTIGADTPNPAYAAAEAEVTRLRNKWNEDAAAYYAANPSITMLAIHSIPEVSNPIYGVTLPEPVAYPFSFTYWVDGGSGDSGGSGGWATETCVSPDNCSWYCRAPASYASTSCRPLFDGDATYDGLLITFQNLHNAMVIRDDTPATIPGTTTCTMERILDAVLDPQQSLTQPAQMARVGGWAELKGHQMWTTRRSNLACIGRYEKLFKIGGQEDFVLTKAGASFTTQEGRTYPWPLGWRGYVGDKYNEFEEHASYTGLDHAQEGDIIVYEIHGMKRVAYVESANHDFPAHVTIKSWDHSKFPTATGAGMSWGMGFTRTIYKDVVPRNEMFFKYKNALGEWVETHINDIPDDQMAKYRGQPSCEDPNFTSCALGAKGTTSWSDVKVYRPSEDNERRRCLMANFSNFTKNVQSATKTSGSPAWCINSGFDAPAEYRIGYEGPGSAALVDTSLCGPGWNECLGIKDVNRCFPYGTGNAGTNCIGNTFTEPTTPPSECTEDEWVTARANYQAAVNARGTGLEGAQAALEAAKEAENSAIRAYNDYFNSKAAELAMLNERIALARATAAERAAIEAARARVDAANAVVATKQSAVNTATTNLSTFDTTNAPAIASYNAILENAADPTAYTAAEIAASDALAAINANRALLNTALETANTELNAAQAELTAASEAFGTLPTTGTGTPDPADVAARAAILAEIDSLNGIKLAATADVAAKQLAVDSFDPAGPLPELTCPFP